MLGAWVVRAVTLGRFKRLFAERSDVFRTEKELCLSNGKSSSCVVETKHMIGVESHFNCIDQLYDEFDKTLDEFDKTLGCCSCRSIP